MSGDHYSDDYRHGYTNGHAVGRQAAYDGEEPRGYGQALRDMTARALAAEAALADAEARGRAEGRLSGLFAAWCAADQSRTIASAVRESETTTHGRTHATGVIDGADMHMESIAALAKEATDGR